MIHKLGFPLFSSTVQCIYTFSNQFLTHCQQFPKLMVECERFDLHVLLDRNHDLHAESVEEHLSQDHEPDHGSSIHLMNSWFPQNAAHT